MRRREAAGLLAALPGVRSRGRAAKTRPTPEEHYRTALAIPERNRGEFGEGFCRHAAYKVTCAAPPGFARKHAGGMVAGFDFTFHDCWRVSMREANRETLLSGGKANGLLLVRWKGERPGDARVRWTFAGGGYREFPVTARG